MSAALRLCSALKPALYCARSSALVARTVALTSAVSTRVGKYRLLTSTPPARLPKTQSYSLLHPIGVEAALRAASDPTFKPTPTLLQKEFSLAQRVAVVTGGHQGLGLEVAEALAEAGAVVYCLDILPGPKEGSAFRATQTYVSRLGVEGARLEYAQVDVTDQKAVWNVVESIAVKEGRLDVCVAAAGILREQACLEYTAEEFEKMMKVNVNGAFYTAQAAGRQMDRLKIKGSIVLVASMSGSIANRGQKWVAYNTSKSAVLQMARSMACELGPKGIRVNTLSPGYIYTAMTHDVLHSQTDKLTEWSTQNPLGRLGRPDELRGVVAWLASDASTFCTGSDILVSGGQHAW
ncbi:NAD-binding protein [Fomitiporia mediterranea MF3/22]|uniref:NAD-binding protein n=1 Tax=Fomitiporia mediterranea (strain MF3/22) TaxID=694068 RepID=UPI0004409B28|nr:NAD-binding protein [Fomitiporia mediterranea MF3/22]EJD06298.1 NAD-binding protein [Fomitiporia mediterranea MF3/22]